MYQYGVKSLSKLDSCHPSLKQVAIRALELSPYDITIVHGYRGEEVQNALFDRNASQKRFPDSKHNHTLPNGTPCSLAIDVAPYVKGKIAWDDDLIFGVLAGVFMAAASEIGCKLRYGGDWDGDGLSKGDQRFMDLGHLELVV